MSTQTLEMRFNHLNSSSAVLVVKIGKKITIENL